MIQDIKPHRLINVFCQGKVPGKTDKFFVFRENEILFRDTEDDLRFPSFAELSERGLLTVVSGELTEVPGLLPEDAAGDMIPVCQYAFAVDDDDFYFLLNDETEETASALNSLVSADPSWIFVPVRELRKGGRCPQETVYAAFTAFHLKGWYRGSRFCGRCGGKMKPADNERALDCCSCGRRIYPRINPAVIVGVTNGDELLITRYADRPLAVDALIAGFTEIGETLEETVAREVMEEAGLKVRNIRYYKSQPWGIADDILAGFYCDVDGDPSVHMDDHELKSAIWTRRSEIKGQPDNLSLTNEMMLTFRDGKEPR